MKTLENVDFYHHSRVAISTYTIERTDGGKSVSTVNLTILVEYKKTQ